MDKVNIPQWKYPQELKDDDEKRALYGRLRCKIYTIEKYGRFFGIIHWWLIGYPTVKRFEMQFLTQKQNAHRKAFYENEIRKRKLRLEELMGRKK